ncbi:MAG TPA: GNAT family N-acetyltransferase [Actinocrinis sp.]|nr:GNAT family N-acetyltransferase [Actinocrinis sp.]
MQIPSLLDLAAPTDADLREVYALLQRCKQAATPDDPYYTVDQLVATSRHRPPGTADWEWVLDGGYALLSRRSGEANGSMELVVAPEVRRRGLGTSLAGAVLEQARAAGCAWVVGHVADPAGMAFARSLGAREGNSELVSALHLADAVVRPEPVPGYSVRSWVDEPPLELFASWVVAVNAITDAPHSEEIDDTPLTEAQVRAKIARIIARGQQMRVTVVLDQDGTVVGSTELGVGIKGGSRAQISGTSVLAAHRRRGLARWLKAEALARLIDERPDVQIVRTSNDSTNTGMLAVNHAVGFNTVARYTDMIFTL